MVKANMVRVKRNLRIFAHIACSYCGASAGQQCRNKLDGSVMAADFICVARRRDYESGRSNVKPAETGLTLDPSLVVNSPVVGGSVHTIPVDRVARRVTGHVSHWDTTPGEVRSVSPLPTRAIPPDMPDLLGKMLGRLSVVGLSALHSGNHREGGSAGQRAVWVCRCQCGYYVLRTSKAIRKNIDPLHVCDKCDSINRLRSYAVFQETGHWPK